ncbi:MAG: amidohydrolase, partial [Clostridia bacterium]|nr:amidohydrolase [Clostridia bacterium]
GKAGLIATVGRKSGKTILLRADIDGLPITEKTGLAYACKNGRMHACGHDLHATMLLGAAKLLKAHEKELKGKVKLLFQPAEELLEGAKDVLEGGLLDEPKPDAAVMLHVLTGVPISTGKAVVASGGVSAPAADFFHIKVQGKGCHGAAPWNGVDALTVASHILLGLQEISARELPAATPAILTVGTVQSEGADNAIADGVTLKGTLRSFDEKVRKMVKKRMGQISKNIAKAFRATVEVAYNGGCPTLINDEKISLFVEETLKKTLGAERVVSSNDLGGDVRANSGGSEDFAYISHKIPSVMIALGAGQQDKGYPYPLHHPKAAFDEGILWVGSAIFTLIGCKYLS